MVEASPAPTTLGTLLRISVVAGDRRLDVGAPGSIPVAEIIPGFARTLRLLDAGSVHGGYRLLRSDGSALSTAISLIAQSVSDGEVLTMEVGATSPGPRVYDDVVEAVSDAVEKDFAPWTQQDSSRAAVGAAAAFLLAGAIMLVGAGNGSLLPPVIAASVGALVLVSAAVIARRDVHLSGAQAMILCGAVFWAVAGLLFTAPDAASLWGWPLAAAGAGAVLAGAAGLALLPRNQEICIIPLAAGVILASAGTVVATTDLSPGNVLAMTVAVAVTASNGIPWLALSSTNLRVVSPQSDEDVFTDPAPIDPEAVGRSYRRGYRLQFGLRAAVAVVTLIATPAVASLGLTGVLLLVLAYTGMLLSVRQTFSRADVFVVMATGIVGLTFTTLIAALAHPQWRGSLMVAVAVVAAVVVGACLIAPRPRAAFGRVADSVELLSLALLLPLGVAAAGLI